MDFTRIFDSMTAFNFSIMSLNSHCYPIFRLIKKIEPVCNMPFQYLAQALWPVVTVAAQKTYGSPSYLV